MTETHFIAHSPIGPTGRLVWETWTDLLVAIEVNGWTGLVDRFVPNLNLPPARFVNGHFVGYGERH